ncbi:hypothetical protein KL930_005198 [Ogataea haglerorum]|uniref:NADH:ubiquinone oxidoreductase intermediate-associated protein 30 domain-containing protein n=1 Tax=Ogataea haglerorum TaxID=1937702 RepID=A0AAN6HYD7_9ASCO|nr:uncharacterized protein KL911_005209 [Ogataea haglerorum]KAG7691568.1 hypothetical protein KL915_005118 [Ogataea haglerorum]KAG7691965.1 hypothetical protein KL951_005169 [Ogataea haglerorum]KAG7702319.1 hypothetical protein KL914_005248 [Ogataea haglerorum]KAG7702455.1 hypothetical protein KL950_005270 [Ogataea haglerorum]KAG7713200.1 hypothetical protein KL913_005181 [Ogataea haglerorum]
MLQAFKNYVSPSQQLRLVLLDFKDPKTFSRIMATSDESLGGFSTVHFDPYRDKDTGNLCARFHGNLNLNLPADPKVKDSGWAMFKTKDRQKKHSFRPFYLSKRFANFWWDLSTFYAVHLRVKNQTPARKFMINFQTDTSSRTDLFQHRVFLENNSQWQDVFISFSDFVLTNKGKIQIQYDEEFEKDRVRSVGLSIADKKFGEYSLLIDTIECLYGDEYAQKLTQARNNPLLQSNDSMIDRLN